jgi:hypothetical protein
MKAGRLALYDGQQRMGDIAERERGFDARDADGNRLGRFPSQKAAVEAVTRAYGSFKANEAPSG